MRDRSGGREHIVREFSAREGETYVSPSLAENSRTMCSRPPLRSRNESLLGAIGEEVLETRFHIFIAQDENRSPTPFKELSSPVALLLPAQFTCDVGVNEIHDAGEVCSTPYAEK